MAEARYIGTSKHEHPFSMSIVCDVNTLPEYDYGKTQQSGWVEHCGTAAWIGDCRTCGKRVSLIAKQVLGRYSEERKCDARCTSAKGHNCECQCGGKMHGADYGVRQ